MNDSRQQQQQQQIHDPFLQLPSHVVRDGDHVLLVFGDGRQIFAQCCQQVSLGGRKGGATPVRINKRSYPTYNLVGLTYGTVLEQGSSKLEPLPAEEDLLPVYPGSLMAMIADESTRNDDEADTAFSGTDSDTNNPSHQAKNAKVLSVRDNRHLIDNNQSQGLNQKQLARLREEGVAGSHIVSQIIEHSATFEQKTNFSKAKYVARKQMKYQPRCRLVRCTAATICDAMYAKDPRKIMNLRDDTLGQILCHANLSAGCRTLVFETTLGIVAGAVAERMGGYGKVFSIYSGQQPTYLETIGRYNLSFAESLSIRWIHAGDVFSDNPSDTNHSENSTNESNIGIAHDSDNSDDKQEEVDTERLERNKLQWPCPLQCHTREYIQRDICDERKQTSFLLKRSARFARKLTRTTPIETKTDLMHRSCDSLIIVARHDPTETLLSLFHFLTPSCPFVVFCEFIEPLTICFRQIQKQELAINLRLSDTWMREYQILPDRTHPMMNMSQSGGFLLTGIKLDPKTGRNEIDVAIIKEIRQTMGGRRGRKTTSKLASSDSTNRCKPGKLSIDETNEPKTKRPRIDINDADSD